MTMLNQTQIDAIREWIDSRAGQFTCAVCNGTTYAVGDRVGALPAAPTGSRDYIPVVWLTCGQCGCLVSFQHQAILGPFQS